MPNTSDVSCARLARQSLEDGAHYVTSVTAMADRKEVVAGEDVLATNGIKLVAQGAALNSGLRERLLKHKLMHPIDRKLIVSAGITPESLATQAAHLIQESPALSRLAARSGDALAMRHGLARIPLPPQMAFKLTVAREERPELFRNLLVVALISHYLALRLALTEAETSNLLTAALLHDLGELYVDPALLAPHHVVSDQERRHIYVHPIIGYLIACKVGGIAPAVSAAVLQHHERLDGSGYPYGLHAEQIGAFARILGIADVCASILARQGNMERLGSMIRLNRMKYAPTLLDLLQEGLVSNTVSSAPADFNAMPQLKSIASLLDRWRQFRAAVVNTNHGDPPHELKFLFERMVTVRSVLLELGFDPDSLELLVDLARTDSEMAAELMSIVDEVRWQFAEIAREIDRHEKPIAPSLMANELGILEEWIKELQLYVQIH